MYKKVLIRILIGLAIVFVIINAVIMVIPALAFWIYLGVILEKEKRIIPENLDPESVQKHMKTLKTLLIIASISLPVSISGIVMHNIRSGQTGTEEILFFYVGLIALYVFILASAGGMLIFFKGRQKR